MKLEKVFRNCVCNFVLLATVCGLLFVTFSDDIENVFSPSENRAIYRGNTEKQRVSLMFNVYWGTEYIEPILETLEKHNVKATFFIGGSWANKNSELLEKIAEFGHEIGNHGYFHKDHDRLNYNQNSEEIFTAEKMIEAMCGVKTRLFAPPSGAFSKTTLKSANDLGYQVIMWSKDTIDWRDQDVMLIYSRATKDLKAGDFVLMHPTNATLKALNDILEYYETAKFEVVTVSENMN